MEKKEQVAALRELMEKWNEKRAQWIKVVGSDKGFADWFTAQIKGAVR